MSSAAISTKKKNKKEKTHKITQHAELRVFCYDLIIYTLYKQFTLPAEKNLESISQL